MNEWLAADRNVEYLLHGGRLDQLHGWANSTSLPLSASEKAFLDASVAARDLTAAAERELEQRAVDAERRNRQRVRQLVGVGLAALLVAAMAVFGIVQWRSAEDAKSTAEEQRADAEAARSEAEAARATAEADRALLDHSVHSQDMVDFSANALSAGDPELAVAYAVQGVREFAQADWTNSSAMDALHWALQDLGVRYDVTSNTPVAIRPGPNGPTGVYVLTPADLVDFAESAVDRRLTDGECKIMYDAPTCPPDVEIPPDTVGARNFYGATPQSIDAMAGTRVTIAESAVRDDVGLVQQLETFIALTGVRVVLIHDAPDLPSLSTTEVEQPDVVFEGGRGVAVTDRPEVRLLLDHLTNP